MAGRNTCAASRRRKRRTGLWNRQFFLSPDWVEHDKGLLTEEEEIRDFISNAPEYEKEIRQTYENLGECVWEARLRASLGAGFKEPGISCLCSFQLAQTHLRSAER